MKKVVAELRLFFTSQPFADGLRITVAVLLPALLASFFHSLQLGMLFSLGALCVSLTDSPGAIVNRTNTMLFTLAFVFATALLTELVRNNLLLLGSTVAVLSFFFSMFVVYGLRGAAVGNAALLVLVLAMDQELPGLGFGAQAFFILCGGLWYTGVSLLGYQAAPFRPAQRSLGECIRELALFLRIKASFYDRHTDFDANFRKLVAQQVLVSEKQDAVREVLFKTRQIVKDLTPQGRRLLLAFTDAVDLFDEVTATYQDYRLLHQQFGNTQVLQRVATLARTMADELEQMGSAIQGNRGWQPAVQLGAQLQELKTAIDQLPQGDGRHSTLVLKKLLVNVRRMIQRMQDLQLYFVADAPGRTIDTLPFDRFVAHQSLDPRLFGNNLNLKSGVFRHSMRVAIAALAGFVVSKFIAPGHHSYWILMTIIFMMKPSFSLTRQRNWERIVGTLGGGVIGVALLLLVPNKQVLFGLMVVLMLGSYSFMRTRYLLSVCCMTPFVLILFSFLGVGFLTLIQERVIDTLIGCLIALAAGYLLFPAWESAQLTGHVRDMLKANSNYLFRVAELLAGKTVSTADYKLARKEVYVSSANLSSAFQRMMSEPKAKQGNRSALQQLVVLNHILFSNTATLAAALTGQPARLYPAPLNRVIRKTLTALCASLEQLHCPCKAAALESLGTTAVPVGEEEMNADERLIHDQLEFMYRLVMDILKAVKTANIQEEGTPDSAAIPKPA